MTEHAVSTGPAVNPVRLLVVEVAELSAEEREAAPDTPDSNGQRTVNFNAIPGTYDFLVGLPDGGKVLDPTTFGGDINEFVAGVVDDMDAIDRQYVRDHAIEVKQTIDAGGEPQPAELYMKLLVSFCNKPVEVIGNMLATLIFQLIDATVSEEDFDAAVHALEDNQPAS